MPTAKEVRKTWEVKSNEMQAFLEPKKTDNGLNFQGDDFKSFHDRNDELARLHDEATDLEKIEALANDHEQARKSFDEPNRLGLFSGSPQHGDPYASQRPEVKTLGQAFLESQEYKANADKKPSGTGDVWKVEVKGASIEGNLESDSIKAALTATGAPYGTLRQGIVGFPTRPNVMRRLVTVDDPTIEGQSGISVQFIRQNLQTFGADIVPEGQLKPETSLGTELVVIRVEAIAHFIKVTDQAVRFIPGIQDLLDRKGTQGVLLAEDDKMLNYDGAAGWKGFLKQTGVQTAARGTDDQFTAFHNGMNKVMFTGFANVSGAVMNHNDWHNILTLKDTQGRFIYGDPSQAMQDPRLWGVPVVVTPAIGAGTVLLGDFANQAKFWVPGGLIVKVGYVNDDLQKNQQTIVVEEYGMLEIDIPQAFCVISGF